MCVIRGAMGRIEALHRALKAGQKSVGHSRHGGALSLYARYAPADCGVVVRSYMRGSRSPDCGSAVFGVAPRAVAW